MKRTRKWAFVAQEAIRLAGLGLSQSEIARRLEVNKSSVSRWLRDGKIPAGGNGSNPAPKPVTMRQTPEQWSAEVRATYALDATDDQLVTHGEEALRIAGDPGVSVTLRMSAWREFRAIVKQLALVSRQTPAKQPTPEARPRQSFQPPRRLNVDPRQLLKAVG